MTIQTDYTEYAARLENDYPEARDRLTVLFRLLWIIPIAIILGLIAGAGDAQLVHCVLKQNRGELGRQLNMATDYIIMDGYLSGAIVSKDEEQ